MNDLSALDMAAAKRLLPVVLAGTCFAVACLSSAGSVAEPQCICRYAGQSYAEGTCVCMDRPSGAQELACCGMVLNNTSWRFTGEGCPVADAKPADPVQTRPSAPDGPDTGAKVSFVQPGASVPLQRE